MQLFAAFLATRPSVAQHMNAKDSPCDASAATSDLYSCFADALHKQDTALNAYYSRVQSTMEGDDLARLKASQRLWIQFRDANCEGEYELYSGGTAAPVVKEACLEAMTRHRVKELQEMYEWRLIKWEK